MNLIFFSRRQGEARHLHLTHPLTMGACAVVGLAVLGLAFGLGVKLGQSGLTTRSQAAEVSQLRQSVQDRIDAMAIRVGEINAQVIRIEALGKRLTQMANISSGELNFDSAPAVGGPDDAAGFDAGFAAQLPDLTQMLDAVEEKLQTRDSQLLALENVILSRSLNQAIRPDGRPVVEGYISSYYGERQDPFNGHEAMHKGVDFAGVMGSQVVAVAAGVVTRAEGQAGYGNLVEINHGNGFVTRYGHNQKVLVGVGDTVVRGQSIALMGSTGRSTGPHVHFEVLRNGRQVNPIAFVDP
ncbi:MAG: hypothetical protein RL030_1364 [Pseudomonadota bacterium]